jgi:hypothetical protein
MTNTITSAPRLRSRSCGIAVRMLRLSVLLLVLALSPRATRADLIYTWHETDEQTVSGSLDVSLQALTTGTITNDTIISGSFTIPIVGTQFLTKNVSYNIPISSSGIPQTNDANIFYAFKGRIEVPFVTTAFDPAVGATWQDRSPIASGQGYWTVAGTNAVPEPSTLRLMVIGVAALIAYGCSRHRRHLRRQVSA